MPIKKRTAEEAGDLPIRKSAMKVVGFWLMLVVFAAAAAAITLGTLRS